MENQNQNQQVETKVCSLCKQELPLTMFHKNHSRKDGLQTYCKECGKVYFANRTKKKKDILDCVETINVNGKELIKVENFNNELAKFTPRQLMQELKARGFKWDYMIEPQRKIMYDKI